MIPVADGLFPLLHRRERGLPLVRQVTYPLHRDHYNIELEHHLQAVLGHHPHGLHLRHLHRRSQVTIQSADDLFLPLHLQPCGVRRLLHRDRQHRRCDLYSFVLEHHLEAALVHHLQCQGLPRHHFPC